MLDEFTKPKLVSTLESAILIAKAKWESAQNSHELEIEKLADLDDQIAKCTITAPQDGIVKYAHVMDGRGDQEFIVEEGTVVRERQAIIRLPNADSMRVNLTVNESLVQYVQPGLAADDPARSASATACCTARWRRSINTPSRPAGGRRMSRNTRRSFASTIRRPICGRA